MVVLGDVFAVISFLVGVCLSAWALTIGMAVLFQRRSSLAQEAVELRPWLSFFVGLGLLAIAGTISLTLWSLPLPGPKFLGFLGTMTLLGLAFTGMSGIAKLVGHRIQPLEPNLSNYRALGRGAGLIVVASLLPVVGWFVFAPLVLVFSTGAGFLALIARSPVPSAPKPTYDMGVA